MGLRVRILLAVLSLLTIGALAVPLALSLADRRTSALADERGRQIEALADSAAASGAPLQRLVDRYHEVYGEGLMVVDSDGNPTRIGYRVDEETGKRVRISKRNGKDI